MSDVGHREIEHTADVAFECWADDVEGLFVEATRALCELCYEPDSVRERESRSLHVTGSDREDLLVQWLQEVYLLLELESWLAARVTRIEVSDGEVSGTLSGEPVDRDRHRLHTEIKAITYHGLHIERGEDGLWRATVILDV